jgi:NTE family protein
MQKLSIKESVDEFRRKTNGQVVLVLQGGGALGAYQVGVYKALHEAGIEPDWLIGTSIGAINAGLIAGQESWLPRHIPLAQQATPGLASL